MRPSLLISLITISVFCTAVCSAAEQQDLTGYYKYSDQAKIDEDLTVKQLIEVDVFERDGTTYVDWMSTIDPPGRVVGDVSPAKFNEKRELVFTTEDGFGEKGQGHFYKLKNGYVLDVEIVRDRDSMASSLYGVFHVKRVSPEARDDRHHWSLGTK